MWQEHTVFIHSPEFIIALVDLQNKNIYFECNVLELLKYVNDWGSELSIQATYEVMTLSRLTNYKAC